MKRICHLLLLFVMVFSMTMPFVCELHADTATNKNDPFSGIQIENGDVYIGDASKNEIQYKSIYEKYRGILYWVVGLILVSSFAMLIYRFFKMASSADNEMERRKAIRGILVSSMAIAMMGSVGLIIAILYGMLKL